MDTELKQTPLRRAHLKAGARLVPFAGWEMPVQYRGINEEHQVVRCRAGVFDVSHMGQIQFEGPGALPFLQHLLPPELAGLGVGRLTYAVMCNPQGGAVDDLLVYRLKGQVYLVVVNASRLAEDREWVLAQAQGFSGVVIEDRSEGFGMLALQGPQAAAMVAQLGGGLALELAYLECARVELAGKPLWISRSGYTGEDGFEFLCPAQELEGWWAALLEQGAQPCGLGARDVLRTEMGYCLYGHELTLDHTPLEAGLGWSVALAKEPGFIGQQALRRQREEGLRRRLVGLRLGEQGIPRPQCRVLDADGREVGTVSSGTYSPALACGIALAYVEVGHHQPGTPLWVELRGKARRAKIVKTPFVPANTRRRGDRQ